MISWRDEALILATERYGESHALVEVFTSAHGRYRALVQGGGSRKKAPQLQPGQIASVEYQARLETHLGSMKVEPKESHVAALMDEPLRLAGFQSLIALLRFSMEERDPHPELYRACLNWLPSENFLQNYVLWERVLLKEAGFELELERCAVTGAREDLAFVSPKTGRAVTRDAAGEWADQLLPYSVAFRDEDAAATEVIGALAITEYFLTHWLAQMIGKAELPKARARFLERIERAARAETP